MGGRGGGSSIASKSAAPSVAQTPGSTPEEQAIRRIYNQMPDSSIATISRIRKGLDELGWSREKQDIELIKLVRERKIVLTPQSNQKVLTQRQRDDALRMGNEDKHLISWQRGR